MTLVFAEPVDLVIRSVAELALHDQEMTDHPEWFDGLTIGIAYETDPVMADAIKAAAADAGGVSTGLPTFEAPCARDLADPAPGVTGRWLLCSGSGHAGAYFVPSESRPSAGAAAALVEALLAMNDEAPVELAALGYYSPAAGTASVDRVEVVGGGSRVNVTFGNELADLAVPDGGAIFDVREQALRTVVQHFPDAQVQLGVSGACDVAEVREAVCRVFTRADLQPREGGFQ